MDRIEELNEQVERMAGLLDYITKEKLNTPWKIKHYAKMLARFVDFRQMQTIKVLKQRIAELEADNIADKLKDIEPAIYTTKVIIKDHTYEIHR
jgi:transcription elongation factor GreA-like protein